MQNPNTIVYHVSKIATCLLLVTLTCLLTPPLHQQPAQVNPATPQRKRFLIPYSKALPFKVVSALAQSYPLHRVFSASIMIGLAALFRRVPELANQLCDLQNGNRYD